MKDEFSLLAKIRMRCYRFAREKLCSRGFHKQSKEIDYWAKENETATGYTRIEKRSSHCHWCGKYEAHEVSRRVISA